MSKVCDICGSKTELFVQTVENENGEEQEVNMCAECMQKAMNPDAVFDVMQNENEFDEIDAFDDSDKKGNGDNTIVWTNTVKTLNFIIMVALPIVGIIVGAMIGNAVSYEDVAGFIGGFLGLFLGAIVGVIIVSFSMLFVEISQNLAALLDEVRKDK